MTSRCLVRRRRGGVTSVTCSSVCKGEREINLELGFTAPVPFAPKVVTHNAIRRYLAQPKFAALTPVSREGACYDPDSSPPTHRANGPRNAELSLSDGGQSTTLPFSSINPFFALSSLRRTLKLNTKMKIAEQPKEGYGPVLNVLLVPTWCPIAVKHSNLGPPSLPSHLASTI